MKPKRIESIDMLRAISAFMIVLLHVSASYWDSADVASSQFCMMTIYNGISRAAVPVFIMISGMFMIPKEITGKYLLKKILRLLMCFYIWSSFYAGQGLSIKYFVYKTINSDDIKYALQELVFGHYHQWFLLMIAGIYLILPFIQKISEDKKLTEYFILIWIITNIIIPYLPIEKYTAQFQVHFTIGYIGYFLLGHYLMQCSIAKMYRICIYVVGVLATLYTILATIIESRITEMHIKNHFGSFSWNVILMAIAIVTLFKYQKPFSERTQKLFVYLSDASLLVYMLHPFLVEKIDMLESKQELGVPAISVLIYGLCVTVYGILKIIQKKGKNYEETV